MLDPQKISTENINYTIEKKQSKSAKKFTEKEVTFDDAPLFFPEGFEKIFLVIYFISLPYIAGLLFLFFYVAEGKKELFLSLNEESSFILTWAIGYEILATLAILYIVKSAISFSKNLHNRNKKFQRP
ncbi:hypothetical protein [Sulfurovum sp.]|uniref:hypothetical protein n=1 Tax=Sulfurovum sp. TaxID=1969726 RepID=UPI00260058FB|nr:hypothetical protein [Sulfurovum sp.]